MPDNVNMGVAAAGSDPHATTPDADRQYLAEIQAEISQPQNPSGGGAGSGFQLNPEQIDAQIQKAQQLLNELRNDKTDADTAARAAAIPAAGDDASVNAAKGISQSYSNLSHAIDRQIQYLQGWLGKLNTAKQNYLNQEHLTADQWDRLSKGLSA